MTPSVSDKILKNFELNRVTSLIAEIEWISSVFYKMNIQ